MAYLGWVKAGVKGLIVRYEKIANLRYQTLRMHSTVPSLSIAVTVFQFEYY